MLAAGGAIPTHTHLMQPHTTVTVSSANTSWHPHLWPVAFFAAAAAAVAAVLPAPRPPLWHPLPPPHVATTAAAAPLLPLLLCQQLLLDSSEGRRLELLGVTAMVVVQPGLQAPGRTQDLRQHSSKATWHGFAAGTAAAVVIDDIRLPCRILPSHRPGGPHHAQLCFNFMCIQWHHHGATCETTAEVESSFK